MTVDSPIDDRTEPGARLAAALNILKKWGCTAGRIQSILRISKTAFYNYQKHPEKASLTADQLERLGYVLNIHASLQMIFENPKNAYGFMAMENHNPYFNGKSPLAVISTGDIADLYETYKQVDALSWGLW